MKFLLFPLFLGATASSCTQVDRANPAAVIIAAEQGDTSWQPLDVHRLAYPFVSGTANGIDVSMLLDLGAEMTSIDASFAKKLGLERVGDITAKGVSGTTDAWFARGVTIEVGSLRFEPSFVVAIDFAPVAERLGRPLPVVLGRELFERAIVELDYSASRVAFHDPERWHSASDAHVLPLFPAKGGKYAIDARIEGRAPVRVQIDTGANDTLVVFHDYVNEARLLEGRTKVSTRLAGGVGGTSVDREATLTKLGLGDIELHDMPATFEPETRDAVASSTCAGRLGGRILSRFRVTIDVPHRRMQLEPAANWDRPFEKNRLGLQGVLHANELEVAHVAAGSPAEHAGWKVGERVTAFDGRAVTSDCWNDWMSFLDRATGTTVALRDGEGRERKLTLAEYY